jgi:hypothetical protein
MRLKGDLIMKRIFAIVLFALASLVTVRGANAQDHRVRATIPFTFIAGGETMPAGVYTITSDDLPQVRIRKGTEGVTVLSNTPVYDAKSGYDKLVFNKYGDQYFLRKVLCPDAHMSLELPVSKTERLVQHQKPNAHEVEQALVALNR